MRERDEREREREREREVRGLIEDLQWLEGAVQLS